MPKRIVEAWADGELVASYPIVLDHLNFSIAEEDFVREAKFCHQEDGHSPSLIDEWIVREPREGDS